MKKLEGSMSLPRMGSKMLPRGLSNIRLCSCHNNYWYLQHRQDIFQHHKLYRSLSCLLSSKISFQLGSSSTARLRQTSIDLLGKPNKQNLSPRCTSRKDKLSNHWPRSKAGKNRQGSLNTGKHFHWSNFHFRKVHRT